MVSRYLLIAEVSVVSSLTLFLPLVEQELPTLPKHQSPPPVFNGVRGTRSLVLCVCFVDGCCPFENEWIIKMSTLCIYLHVTVCVFLQNQRSKLTKYISTNNSDYHKKKKSYSWFYQHYIYNRQLKCKRNTTTVRISLRRDVLDTTLCDKVCQWLAPGRWFSLGTPVPSTNKTNYPDITEILLNVTLNAIALTLTQYCNDTKRNWCNDLILVIRVIGVTTNICI